MKKQITELECDSCECGTVRLVVQQNKETFLAFVKDCDKCKKSFGLKAVSNLIKKPAKNSGSKINKK